MKKIFTLLTLGIMLALPLQAQDWTTDLIKQNPDVIDSVKHITGGKSFYDTYIIYYHQPLQHEHPELGTLPLRALMSVYLRGGDILTKMNQMYINGYGIDDDQIKNPEIVDAYFSSSEGELEGRYDGNLLQPEHRYFGKSCPANPWETLGYCDAKEAAADFHALLDAMKKVFKGKWAVSGVSKGGVAAAIQHAYYPDDAECFVSYVAPFMFSEQDGHMLDYMMNNAWTPEVREEVLHIQKEMLHRPSVFKMYYPEEHSSAADLNKNRCNFLFRVCTLDHEIHKERLGSAVEKQIAANRAYLKSKGLDDYTDDMLIYMLLNSDFRLDSDYEGWYNQKYGNQSDDISNFRLPMPAVFSVEDTKWIGHERTTAYLYQQKHELGYYDLNFEFFYDTQEEVDSVTTLWRNTVHNMIGQSTGNLYDSVEYDPSLMEFVCQQTANSQKPMLFLYGNDDLWTGARMPEQYINNDNVRLYILPGLTHANTSISGLWEADPQPEIWAFIDNAFQEYVTAIEQVKQKSEVKTCYNLYGIPVGDDYKGIVIKDGRKVVR